MSHSVDVHGTTPWCTTFPSVLQRFFPTIRRTHSFVFSSLVIIPMSAISTVSCIDLRPYTALLDIKSLIGNRAFAWNLSASVRVINVSISLRKLLLKVVIPVRKILGGYHV